MIADWNRRLSFVLIVFGTIEQTINIPVQPLHTPHRQKLLPSYFGIKQSCCQEFLLLSCCRSTACAVCV